LQTSICTALWVCIYCRPLLGAGILTYHVREESRAHVLISKWREVPLTMQHYSWKDKAVLHEMENQNSDPSSTWRMGKKLKLPPSERLPAPSQLEHKQRGTTAILIL